MAQRRTVAGILIIIAALALLALSMAQAPVYLSEEDQVVVQLHNQLGFEILRGLAGEEENVLISPTSIALALSMVYNGARKQTAEAIARVLGASDMDIQELNEASGNMIRFLNHADPDVRLSVANAVWAREGTVFREDFLKTCERDFDAEVDALNFSSPEAVDTINNWISRETRGRIPQILDSIDPLDVMFLTNAVYFKGAWTIRFDEGMTRDGTFTLEDGQEKTVPMMRWKEAEEVGYLEDQGLQAIQLPYGDRERIDMFIFLPSNLTAFVENLSASSWNRWMDAFDTHKGVVIMPKFTFDCQYRLNDVLTDLGMGMAFQNAADFTGMADPAEVPEGIYIAYVTHRTFIEVNERGTEAAGGTLFAMRTWSMPLMFRVDRPFLFAIRDGQSGAILFLGLCRDPELPS